MTIYKGTIAKQPIIKDKVIFSAIKMQNETNPVQLVLFKSTVENQYAELLSTLNLNDSITVIGKEQRNKLNNQREISIAQVHAGDYKQTKDKYAVDPETDFIIGGQTAYGTIELIERPKHEAYYTDGEMYWYKGNDTKAPCNL